MFRLEKYEVRDSGTQESSAMYRLVRMLGEFRALTEIVSKDEILQIIAGGVKLLTPEDLVSIGLQRHDGEWQRPQSESVETSAVFGELVEKSESNMVWIKPSQNFSYHISVTPFKPEADPSP